MLISAFQKTKVKIFLFTLWKVWGSFPFSRHSCCSVTTRLRFLTRQRKISYRTVSRDLNLFTKHMMGGSRLESWPEHNYASYCRSGYRKVKICFPVFFFFFFSWMLEEKLYWTIWFFKWFCAMKKKWFLQKYALKTAK